MAIRDFQCALVALLHLLDQYECKDFQIVAIDLVEARVQKGESVVRQLGGLKGTVKCTNPEEAKTGSFQLCAAPFAAFVYSPILRSRVIYR